jgi:hypothetical protein
MKRIFSCLFLGLWASLECTGQDQINRVVVQEIEAKLEKDLRHHYNVRALNVNTSINNPSVSGGRIRDPHKTLVDCFIFIAESLPDTNLEKPKGFIGVWKRDSVIWRSDPLSSDLSTLGGFVTAVDDLNKDGNDEIVISQNELPGAASSNYLWVFAWDGRMGRLVTDCDDRGESVLAFVGEYEFVDVDNDGVYEIKGSWYVDEEFNKTRAVVYGWNGSLYGKWGKTSKYLLKGKSK